MISVIIPTYNRAATIRKSIDSVLNQTYADIEVIIVDDGSSDNTDEIVQKIQDDRLKYLKHKTNLGACAARNTGIEAAKGEYIAFQDSGDIWHKDKLMKQLNIMKSVDADIVFCNKQKLGQESKGEFLYKEGFINTKENVFGIGTPTIVGKAAIFKGMPFDERLPRLQDFELMLRIRETRYTIYYLSEILVDYSCSDDGISVSPIKLLQACQLLLEIHPDMRKKCHKMSDILAGQLLVGAKMLDKDDKEMRKEMCKLAFKYSIRAKVIVKYFLLSMNISWEKNAKGYVILRKMK